MNTVALITGITALVGAVTGLIVVVVHIIRHQPMPGDPPAKPAAKNGLVNPSPPEWKPPA